MVGVYRQPSVRQKKRTCLRGVHNGCTNSPLLQFTRLRIRREVTHGSGGADGVKRHDSTRAAKNGQRRFGRISMCRVLSFNSTPPSSLSSEKRKKDQATSPLNRRTFVCEISALHGASWTEAIRCASGGQCLLTVCTSGPDWRSD